MARLGTEFGKLWTAAAVANLGDGVLGAALPLLVAGITRDPLLVSGVAIAQRLPWFLLAVLAGALADRTDRRRLMILTHLVRAGLLTVLTLAILGGWGTLPLIYLVALGLGVAETFFDTSAEAILPAVVAPNALPAANGRLQGAEWLANSFIGPPVGALLFASAAAAPFGINAVTFAASALLLLTMSGTFRAARLAGSRLRVEIGEGLRWLLRHRLLRTLALMAGVTNLFATAIAAIFVLYAQDVLGVSEVGYGVLLSSLGVGGLIGAVVAPKVVAAVGPGTTALGTVGVGVVVALAIGVTSNPGIAGVAMAAVGGSITAWNVVSVSLRQSLTPDHLRARVAGAARTLAWGSQPLGALVGGVVAAVAGLRAPFFVAAVAWLLMLVLAAPVVNNRSIEAARRTQPV